MFIRCIKCLFSFFLATSASILADQNILYIYNWSDYIGSNTISNFEKKNRVKIFYDVFDSNEMLEGKLMSGNTGFDIVVPSANFLGRQISTGIFQPLDKNRLPNYKNLDSKILQFISLYDPDNKYAIPYMWGTTGIGYNIDKIITLLGKNAPVNSWDLVFKSENLEKLKSCGISFLDAPSEIYAIVLNYLNFDPNSEVISNYTESATHLLLKLRPNIRYFHSSKYINDLANGDICLAIGWIGDIMQAAHRAKEAKNGINIAYSIPKEGTLAFFDVLAIPTDAKNLNEAYQFINYLLEPQVIADISNQIFYANGNKEATALIKKELIEKLGSLSLRENSNLFILKIRAPKIDRVITRSWIKVKKGK